MKKAFIGKGIMGRYIAFTRWKWRGDIAEVHSEANKYDVDFYVKSAIVNWIGERIGIGKENNLSDEELMQLIGKDFNELADELRKEQGVGE